VCRLLRRETFEQPLTVAPAIGATQEAQDRSNSKAAFSLAGVVAVGR
jgi:hypothetical protein